MKMKPISCSHHLSHLSPPFHRFHSSLPNPNPLSLLAPTKPISVSLPSCFNPHGRRLISLSPVLASSSDSPETSTGGLVEDPGDGLRVEVGNPSLRIPSLPKLSLSDQAFFLLAFVTCTTAVAFMSLVAATVPTLYAMGRAATSFSKLAETAREELPSTMAAIRLSSLEISDLTLELTDLSHEITDGVSKSTQVVQAAEAGIRQIGAVARQQTMSMIEERANLPVISLQPVVVGAAKKTSQAVGKATKSLLNLISGGEADSDYDDDTEIERADL